MTSMSKGEGVKGSVSIIFEHKNALSFVVPSYKKSFSDLFLITGIPKWNVIRRCGGTWRATPRTPSSTPTRRGFRCTFHFFSMTFSKKLNRFITNAIYLQTFELFYLFSTTVEVENVFTLGTIKDDYNNYLFLQ
jgi:hypothetical protein